MNKRTKIILHVNEQAQGEDFYSKSKEMGTLAAEIFTREKKDLEKHRAQMTGLENIAETTLKVTDVLDFIKKQIARQRGWKEEYQGKRLGESLKQYIENDIKEGTNDICVHVGIGYETNMDKRDRQYVYLELVRQFIRQVVVQYEYRVSQIAEELQQNAQRARASAHTNSQR